MRAPLLTALLLALTLLTAKSAHANEPTLRLFSMNVWGAPYVSPEREARIEALIDNIRALAPDVVTLQEVWMPADAERIAQELGDAGLRHSHHFAEGGGSGLWVGSRFPIEGVRFERFALGSVPSIPWHLDWISDKGYARVRLQTEAGPVDVINTHLQASYSTASYPFIQLAQALQLARGLDPADPTPLVVAGDLNALPGSAAVESLLAWGCLSPAAPDFDVDAVLVRSGLRAVSARRVLTEPVRLSTGSVRTLSDHPGWLVELAVGPSAGTCASVARLRDVDLFLSDERGRVQRWLWTHRALALVLLLGAVMMGTRLRGRPRLLVAMAVTTLVAVTWLGYLGWRRGPLMLRAIETELNDALSRG